MRRKLPRSFPLNRKQKLLNERNPKAVRCAVNRPNPIKLVRRIPMKIKYPSKFSRRLLLAPALILLLNLFSGGALRSIDAQTASSFDRERGRAMLSAVKDDIKKNYYDPEFHGMDLETRFKAADEKIKQA